MSCGPCRTEKAGVAAEDVAGISLDATCSLVLRDFDGGQLSSSAFLTCWSAADCPTRRAPAGADLGPLAAEAAEALGLTVNCRVGADRDYLIFLEMHRQRQVLDAIG